MRHLFEVQTDRTHALTCPLQYEYPTALILDPKGFCLQVRFNSQPPKPSNYGMEPYTYYPIWGMVAYQFRQQSEKAGRDKYLHKFDLPTPALQRPLASSTPVYGHDYAQEGQREELHPWEDALSSPNSSREGTPKGGAVPDSEDSSEDPFGQEQPFDGDPLLFPETVVQCKNQSASRETEKRSLSGSKSAVCGMGNESAAHGTGNERVERESVTPKRYHYRNPPMWTTPAGLILIGWRMRCLVCYHQDRHSATCSE